MEKCIESLLPGGDEVEILIVDDGSTKDRTPQIADEYASKLSGDYPGGSSGKRRSRRGRQCGICAMRRDFIIRSWTAMTG